MRRVSSPCALVCFLFTFAAGACASQYSYRFELVSASSELGSTPAQRDRVEDALVKVAIQVWEDSVLLDLTNKTSAALQVEWSKVVLDRGDGTTSKLQPDVDVGWVPPGSEMAVRLVPFVVPRSGMAAEAYQARSLQLVLPLIVLHEPTVYRFHLVAHVEPEL